MRASVCLRRFSRDSVFVLRVPTRTFYLRSVGLSARVLTVPTSSRPPSVFTREYSQYRRVPEPSVAPALFRRAGTVHAASACCCLVRRTCAPPQRRDRHRHARVGVAPARDAEQVRRGVRRQPSAAAASLPVFAASPLRRCRLDTASSARPNAVLPR
jgi:hypothetical protein